MWGDSHDASHEADERAVLQDRIEAARQRTEVARERATACKTEADEWLRARREEAEARIVELEAVYAQRITDLQADARTSVAALIDLPLAGHSHIEAMPTTGDDDHD